MSKYFDNKQIFNTPIVQQYGSHMVIKDGMKSSTKKMHVSFDTRFSNDIVGDGFANCDDNASYNFVLPVRLTNVKSMSVVNVEMPVTYYNISAALGNNTFRITNVVSQIASTVSLPDGQYTADSLQTAMASSGMLGDVKFSINSYGQSVFKVNSSKDPYYLEFYIDSSGELDKNYPKFKLGWLLGFRYVSYPIDPNGTLVSECIVNLNGPRYFHLVVDEFQNGKENKFNSLVCDSMMKKNILARVTPSYGEFPYGTILPANLSNGALITDTRTYKGKVDIQRLNVQLVNEIGTVMKMNGGYIMFCLELEVGTDS